MQHDHSDLPDARKAEIKEAQAEARLRVIVYTSIALIVALLLACLVYTLQAADNAQEAARAAVKQAQINEDILKTQTRAFETMRANDLTQQQRFQALLDSIYGPGVVNLGDPASVPPLNTANDLNYDPRTGRRITPYRSPSRTSSSDSRSPSGGSTARPRPSQSPSPEPDPAPVPNPVPNPVPSPLTTLLCRTLPATCGLPG